MLANVDRQLMEAILKTVESVATRTTLRDNCNLSGRELIRIIVRTADNAPSSTGMAIESMMQAHYDGGLEKYSLRSFTTFYHIYDLAQKLSHVIRQIGENVGTLLDVKIALTSATGRLAPTLTAIRDVLAELEAREHSVVDSSKPGRAFLAKRNRAEKMSDAKPERQRVDPKHHDKPNTFEKEWSAQYGTCRHCGYKH
eukprot:6175935-Pleurochrysis_carterae.AAC.8